MSWLSDTSSNKYKKSYFNGFVDVNGGDIVQRNNNIVVGCGNGPSGITGQTGGIFRCTNQTSALDNEYITKYWVNNNVVGVTGAQGSTGTNGINGSQGPQGNAGTNGTNGSQGPQGNAGTNGINGFQGPQGNAGASVTGSQGPQGNGGTNGTNGSQGPQGNVGPTGPAGSGGSTDLLTSNNTWSGLNNFTNAITRTSTQSTANANDYVTKAYQASNNSISDFNGTGLITGNPNYELPVLIGFNAGTIGQSFISALRSDGKYLSYNPSTGNLRCSASDLAGDDLYTIGSIPYKKSVRSTGWIDAGTPGQYLVCNGSSAPVWSTIPPGPQGSTGATGPQGNAGTNGINGSQGPQGNAGTNGINGSQGPQGNAGTNGINGSQGPQGNAGASVTGSQGPQGTNGSTILGSSNTFTATNTFANVVTKFAFSYAYTNIIPNTTNTDLGYIEFGTISALSIATTNAIYNVSKVYLPLGVWMMSWQVGINCTGGTQNYNSLSFGVSTVDGTSTPNCNRFLFDDGNSTNQIFRAISPCFVTSGSDVINIAPAKWVYLNLSVGFTSTARLSLNTSETYLKAIRIA